MHDSAVAIVGGTGVLGSALALRWARAGYHVIIGSRSAERAETTARRLAVRAAAGELRGMENRGAAAAADIVALTVPFAHQGDRLGEIRAELQGKILVDATVPLVPPRVRTVRLPPEGSAGKAAQSLLGDGVRVVSAFQNVAAHRLEDPGHQIDCDVLVTGNDAQARETVIRLVEAAGLRGWHAGPIENSVVAEALTSVLIFINRHYGIDGAGLSITAEPKQPAGNGP